MELTALVIPTIREESFRRFVKEWLPHNLFGNAMLIVVEDNPKRTFSLEEVFKTAGMHPDDLWMVRHMYHFSWEDIEKQLGPKSWIIPRRSDTVRSFGYWWAWKDVGAGAHSSGPSFEYLMTLDDDCYPEKGYEDLQERHEALLTRTKWFNTLNSVRPRGTPYKNLGARQVHVNHGLWTNVLDYDAPQQLVDPVPEIFTHDNRIVPHGSYFSFCGMNWMCRREAIPLMYHMLMGQMMSNDGNLTKLGLDRFGDIWCGIVMKRICDHLGWVVSTGTPYIHHDRASDPFKNLVKEAAGIGLNEKFWEEIDGIPLSGNDPVECYQQIGDEISAWDWGEWGSYWEMLGRAMVTWAKLFEES